MSSWSGKGGRLWSDYNSALETTDINKTSFLTIYGNARYTYLTVINSMMVMLLNMFSLRLNIRCFYYEKEEGGSDHFTSEKLSIRLFLASLLSADKESINSGLSASFHVNAYQMHY